VAKRKSGKRKRPGVGQRRNSNPPAGVGRSLKLDDLLVAPAGATAAAAAAVALPKPEPVAEATPDVPAKPRLEVVANPDLDGPIVRLAAVWALATFVAAAAGVVAIAVWYAIVAAVAAMQATGSWRKRPRQPVLPLAAAGAAILPLAAAISVPVLAGAAVAVALACLLYRPDPRRSAPALTLLVALSLGSAAAAPVVVRRLGLIEVIVLLSLVGVYDASAFLVGTGATRWWEGPAAGIAFMFAVTLATAAVFVPPFGGATAWLFGALAAALAPLGPMVAPRLIGDPKARTPAVKRLDSLLILGPVWAVVGLLLL
jgi:hypothetical protein